MGDGYRQRECEMYGGGFPPGYYEGNPRSFLKHLSIWALVKLHGLITYHWIIQSAETTDTHNTAGRILSTMDKASSQEDICEFSVNKLWF